MRAKLSPESDQIGIDAEAMLDDLCTSQIEGSIKWISLNFLTSEPVQVSPTLILA
jgi:hypothetical protein